MAAFVPHRPNKYFHVTASNGIVSNSSYTPLAIMTASPIASVRLFDPRCRCRLATFAALPTPSMIERAIIMLTDHRFFGDMLLAPHRQVRRSHRSIHCWHGHAARRSELPRERFSPLTLFGHGVLSELSPLCAAKRTYHEAIQQGFYPEDSRPLTRPIGARKLALSMRLREFCRGG